VFESDVLGFVEIDAGDVEEVVLPAGSDAPEWFEEAGAHGIVVSREAEAEAHADAEGTQEAGEASAEADEAEGEAADGWSGRLDTGASLRSGETDAMDANVALKLQRAWEQNKLTLELHGAYGEVDSEVNTRRLGGSAKLQHYLSDRFFVYGRTGGLHDPAERLELRWEAGGGGGYDLIRNERRSLSLEAGLSYTWEEWNEYSIRELDRAREEAEEQRLQDLLSLAEYLRTLREKPVENWTFQDVETGVRRVLAPFDEVEQTSYTTSGMDLRLGLEYEQQLFQNSTLSESLTLLPRVDSPGEFRAESNLSLDTALSEQLSLAVSLKTEYDSDPGGGDELFSNALIFSSRYSF
jgi:putative salt-induced outer membrane protein YdiY